MVCMKKSIEKVTKSVKKVFKEYPVLAWGGVAVAVGGGLYFLTRPKQTYSLSSMPMYDIPAGEGPGGSSDEDILSKIRDMMEEQVDAWNYEMDTRDAMIQDYLSQVIASIPSPSPSYSDDYWYYNEPRYQPPMQIKPLYEDVPSTEKIYSKNPHATSGIGSAVVGGVTIPVTIVEGRTQTPLPVGTVVKTGGGSYMITGGTPGNYTSVKVD